MDLNNLGRLIMFEGANNYIRSAQEVFSGDFVFASTAVVQKLRPDDHNLKTMKHNYTERWPALSQSYEIMVLAFEISNKVRELFAGFITYIQPSKYDRFQRMVVHDRNLVSDAPFYNNKGGGDSRILIQKSRSSDVASFNSHVLPGGRESRQTWVRKHHEQFRDKVWSRLEGRCAVSNSNVTGCWWLHTFILGGEVHQKSKQKLKMDYYYRCR
jgi:hypothetical protein